MVLGHGYEREWMEMLSHGLVSHLGALEALGERGLLDFADQVQW